MLSRLALRNILCTFISTATLATILLSLGETKSTAAIIESVTEDVGEASDSLGNGGSGCNKLENVSTFVDNNAHPVRAGSQAFRHALDSCGNRSELSMDKTEIGGTYWYGWSVFVPSDWGDSANGFDIIAQWATYPSPRNGNFSCGANGSYITRNDDTFIFKFQYQGDNSDVQCDRYPLATVAEMRGKWVDYVVQAKWTGNNDGFLKLWQKIGDGSYSQKVNYQGRTFWNDEGSGPYFKMGLYRGSQNTSPNSTIYTDEYRLGDASSSFEEVAPGGSGSTPPSAPEQSEAEPDAEPEPKQSSSEPDAEPSNPQQSSESNNFSVEAGGDWMSSGGQYVLNASNSFSSSSAPNNHISVLDETLAANFAVSVDATVSPTESNWDDFSVIFNYQDPNNYYFTSFNENSDDQTNGLFKVENGNLTRLASFSENINPGTNYNIKVERSGDSIKVYRDGNLQSTTTDSSFSGGKAGFGSRNNSATFNNFSINK